MTAAQFALLAVAAIAIGGAIDQLRRHQRFMRIMDEMSRLAEIGAKYGDLDYVRPQLEKLMREGEQFTRLDRRAGAAWTVTLLAFGALMVGALTDVW